MTRKIAGVVAIAAVIGLCTFVPAARAQPVNNANSTVHCETITKGVIKFSPALTSGGTAPVTTIKVSGTLGGCSSSSDPSLVFPEGKSKFKGILTNTGAASNDCAGLAGAGPTTGDLTFTFGVASPGVTLKTSTVHIPAGGSVGGLFLVGSTGYGQFGLGTPGGGAALTVTGGFTGGDNGNMSGGLVITSQAATSTIITLCDPLKTPAGLKQVNLGIAQLDLK